jgi:hypothetical protein
LFCKILFTHKFSSFTNIFTSVNAQKPELLATLDPDIISVKQFQHSLFNIIDRLVRLGFIPAAGRGESLLAAAGRTIHT